MRVGIIGFGLAGEVFHAPLIAAVDGLELAAVVTTGAERAARARAAYPGVEVVEDAAALWGRVDLVVVATPNRFHGPLALEAIGRGLPVVVDKPFTPTVEEGEAVLAAAEAAGVPLTVFQNRRWDGDFLTARRLVEDGTIGPALRFESRFERLRPEVADGWRELPDPEEAGGQLFDLGSHLVDQARELFGHPVRVYAEIDVRRRGAAVDDDVFVALEHPGGVRSHLWMSAVAAPHGPRMALNGLRGGFACDGLDPQEAQLKAGARPGDPGFGERPPGRLTDALGERPMPIERGDYAAFYAAVRDGRTPVDPREVLAGLRVLDAARRSAATHTVIDLEDDPT